MSSNPSPAVAAFLSFLFPGAGQVYAGETRKGLIWAIPMFIFVFAVIWLLLSGMNAWLNLIADPSKRMALLVFNVAFFLYHLAAMLDAYGVAQKERGHSFGYSAGAPIVLAALISLTFILHGLPEVYGYKVHEAMGAIFKPQPSGGIIPSFVPITPGPATPTPATTPTPTPTQTSGSSGNPTPSGSPGAQTPVPTRSPLPAIDCSTLPAWGQDCKLTVLVAGTDSRSDTGVDDHSIRTDTMLFMEVDIQTGKTAMFSFPRNLCTATDGSCGEGTRYPEWLRIPLSPEAAGTPAGQATFPDGNYSGLPSGYSLMNSLWRYAAQHPEIFPGSEGIGPECQTEFDCARGWRALTGTIQEFTGQPIDGIVAVNLKGFTSLVDNLPAQCPPDDARMALTNANCYGGVWIDVPDPVHDDTYHTSQQEAIVVDIPKGCQYFDGEMALAYSRARHETSDYDRARRQQYVLTQIRKQLDPIAMLPNVPALLQVAQQNLFLTFAQTDIPALAQVASRIDADRIYRYDFAPNKVEQLGSMQAIRDKVANIFSEPEPAPDTPSGTRCPPK
jgi:anionic cell wall polymer biosynthesis LytR-Cps2A-Psr (LCP) family protein/TM2 domain-containing membrane protein YozV